MMFVSFFIVRGYKCERGGSVEACLEREVKGKL
jgi:hypothetical protein